MNFFEKKAKEGNSPVNCFFSCLGGLDVGSFPSILKFDSLGQHTYNLTLFFVFLKNLLIMLLLKPTFLKKSVYKNTNIMFYTKNNFFFIKKYKTLIYNYIYLSKVYLNKLLLITNLFFSKINFLILDKDYNYNYLPIPNPIKLKKQSLNKLIKYFDIRVVFFF